MDKLPRIFLASPPRTASMVLANLVYGFSYPDRGVFFRPNYCDYVCYLTDHPIIKTHKIELYEYEGLFSSKYELYFIMSEREIESERKDLGEYDGTVRKIYKEHHNVLVFNYNELTIPEPEILVESVYNKLLAFLPDYFRQKEKSESEIKAGMVARINGMNEMEQRLRDFPFDVVDTFHGIHGSHRNRDKWSKQPDNRYFW